MKTARLEAFTDGVVAIIITITVLELPVPHGASFAAMRGELPILGAYVLSFINVGLYWNNHHHLMGVSERVDGRVLWANLFLLFWLSLAPWVIRWIDEVGFAPLPTASYGIVFGMAAIGYRLLTREMIRVNGRDSPLARAVGRDRKGVWSLLGYVVAVPFAFVAPLLAILAYIAISAVWLVPDPRIEHEVER